MVLYCFCDPFLDFPNSSILKEHFKKCEIFKKTEKYIKKLTVKRHLNLECLCEKKFTSEKDFVLHNKTCTLVLNAALYLDNIESPEMFKNNQYFQCSGCGIYNKSEGHCGLCGHYNGCAQCTNCIRCSSKFFLCPACGNANNYEGYCHLCEHFNGCFPFKCPECYK